MTVSRLHAEDGPELQRIYGRYLAEFGLPGCTPESHRLIEMLLAADWVIALGGRYGGKLIGFGMGSLTYTSIRSGLAFHLGDFFVEPYYRGRGFSQRLLREIADYAKARGVQRIFGNVRPAAVQYFLRSGWNKSEDALLYWDI